MKKLAAYLLLSAALAGQGQSGHAAPPAHAMPPTAPPAPPYTVRGILDPGFANVVAFAIKVPRGWQLLQSFTRKWNGAQPVNQVSLRVLAPDGQRQFDFLPERPYYYQDGPTARSLRQQAQSMGLPVQRHDEYELPPMAPAQYIHQVLLPDLARQGFRFQPGGPTHEQPAGPVGPSAYVDGRLPDGRAARVECTLSLHVQNMGGEQYVNWTALPSITQAPAAELPATYAHVLAARRSFSTNPAWQRQNQQLSQRGQQVNFTITQRDQQVYQDYQRHQQELQRQTTDERQHSQDAIARSRGDLLSGKTKMENPETGQRYRLDDRYNHVYQDRNGALHGSNVPLDAGALDWQELQQVELSSY